MKALPKNLKKRKKKTNNNHKYHFNSVRMGAVFIFQKNSKNDCSLWAVVVCFA